MSLCLSWLTVKPSQIEFKLLYFITCSNLNIIYRLGFKLKLSLNILVLLWSRAWTFTTWQSSARLQLYVKIIFFLKGNLLTKLGRRSELNKFEIWKTELNKRKVKELKWILTKLRGSILQYFSIIIIYLCILY